jgi:hypothetical protein
MGSADKFCDASSMPIDPRWGKKNRVDKEQHLRKVVFSIVAAARNKIEAGEVAEDELKTVKRIIPEPHESPHF